MLVKYTNMILSVLKYSSVIAKKCKLLLKKSYVGANKSNTLQFAENHRKEQSLVLAAVKMNSKHSLEILLVSFDLLRGLDQILKVCQ